MAQDTKRAAVEGDREDRISALPSNVIDGILELLPVKDAARTSILAQKWRYIWAMLPNLVLDKCFFGKIPPRLFKEIVNGILLQHIGVIVKFVLDFVGLPFSTYTDRDIDRWMRYVTRNGVKELTLDLPDIRTYKLPSYIINCPTLTYLELQNCLFNPPNSFLGFQNLIDLYLKKITFVPTPEFCVINVPRLVILSLISCDGTQYLNIVSPQLESLTLREFHSLVLNCFMNCKSLRALVFLEFDQVVEKLTLDKLLSSLPTLEVLVLGSIFLELLSAVIVPKGPPFTFYCLWHLSLSVDFGKLSQISCALQLIKSFPHLSKLQIWVYGTGDNAEAVKYLDRAVRSISWLKAKLYEGL
ncbi:F-box/FBD/LRR-repeat protein At1g13570-like isoform X2 [Nicotiana tabacum]|uniref:F-box/FBD/LRR-repeat protein At1g13570-like isoform X2 n=2 Tax=Nicotiana tabacum TaxID=4097 RepID=A0AC58SD09_TOBAC|nr:F-box/FBD/LRR-repeat protein At1g13570-like isoform X2 [Nicotiana tomentosiformis]XP_016485443.1 PREDICTED: F-box/FBD/LRR-repeat protein At1g13570-like isoform X2 [Nicotiana tabacum]